MLALAANPMYVEMKKSEDEPDVEFPELNCDIVEMDAEELMNTALKNWPDVFEDKAADIEDQLNDIANAVGSQMSVLVEKA